MPSNIFTCFCVLETLAAAYMTIATIGSFVLPQSSTVRERIEVLRTTPTPATSARDSHCCPFSLASAPITSHTPVLHLPTALFLLVAFLSLCLTLLLSCCTCCPDPISSILLPLAQAWPDKTRYQGQCRLGSAPGSSAHSGAPSQGRASLGSLGGWRKTSWSSPFSWRSVAAALLLQ